MSQNDNSAIKGAAIGLLVLFGLFILASWFFDYFTGRGANAQEQILSISVYAPSVSEAAWGNASHGLKAKVSFTRPDPSQFLENTFTIQYQNITDEDILFLNDPNETLKAFSAVNRDKWKLKLTPADKVILIDVHKFTEEEYEEMYTPSLQVIKPGEILEDEIMCRIVNVEMDMGFIDGYFDVSYVLDANDQAIAEYQTETDQEIWTGKIKAGDSQIFLTMPHDGGCNDCHGDADYHHGMLGQTRYCAFCHAEGNAVLNDTCIRCHKNHENEEYGRRRVLGPDGDFDNISKHIPGIIKDADCLVCHDMTRHGYGTVYLKDPNNPGTRTFTDEYTEFCLSCHNSNPPERVEFPEVVEDDDSESFDNPFAGFGAFNSSFEVETDDSNDLETSIYDKSDFINSELFKKGVNCTDCHRSHGSDRPSLLKNVHGPDDKVRI